VPLVCLDDSDLGHWDDLVSKPSGEIFSDLKG
jgi:hypothetical protein